MPADRDHAPALTYRSSRFRVSERLLLTGHSHQAWPDVACAGLVQAFDDAAEAVDDKWDRAMAKADEVRAISARWPRPVPDRESSCWSTPTTPSADRPAEAL